MLVQCNLCGGESRYEPGESMLACSFCGASLALEKPRDVERLILSHARDDASAEASLRSHLAEKERRQATRIEADFSFVPFSMVESDDGRISLVAASRAWRSAALVPYPPAGAYRFLGAVEETETVVPADQADPGASRIIHLPVYELRYDADGWHGRAAVIGESWQVVAEELPPERGRRAGLRGGMIALVLFAGYFALAKIAPNPFIGFVAVAAAAAALYFVHSLRERARG